MGHSTEEDKSVIISNATGWATGVLLILFVIGLINFTKDESGAHDDHSAHATQVDPHSAEGANKEAAQAHH